MAKKIVVDIEAKTKQAQENLERINLKLEQQEDLVKDIQREIEKLEDLRDKTNKKDQNRINEYNEKIEKSNKFLKRTKTRIQENKQERTKANKVLKETVKNQADLGGVLGLVDKQTGGLISSTRNFTGSLGSATKGLKGFKLALIASGIGAFVIALTSLGALFTQSEEGQEKLQRGLAAMGAVVKNVMDAFADLGQVIIDTVTNPIKSLKSLGSGILKFIKNPIDTVTGAFDSAKKAASNFVSETIKEVKAIDEVTKARQKAHHIERDLIVERANANRKINDIRLQAEDRENNSATQRIALLRKAQKLEEEITLKEINAKQLLIDAQQQEMEQGKNTIADKDKLAKLQAELINLDTKKLRSQRLLQTQITTAVNQEKAEKQKAIDEKNAEIEQAKETEQKRLDDIKAIQDSHEERVKSENAIKEEEKAILAKEKELQILENLNATEEQKAAVIAYWNGKIQEGKDKDRDEQKKKDDKNSKDEEKRERAVASAKLAIASQSMSLIGEIAGKGSAVGKAMAVGQATISGIEGVQNAFSTAQKNPITAVFPPYPFIQAGLAGAFSALQIKKIISTKADGKGVSSSSLTSTGTPSVGAGTPSIPVSQPPAFNIVGASGESQLAGAIASQTQTPIKTFVVASDVTTGQALERNTIQGATLG
tara:strand:- start:2010 stop:3977 length:1968 start_codon:yes stop_codon:yes gene_type:complete